MVMLYLCITMLFSAHTVPVFWCSATRQAGSGLQRSCVYTLYLEFCAVGQTLST